jgi:APA family basic amino acid/polyamine antiporter
VLSSPRVFFAMAGDGLFFKKLAEVHPRFRTPAFAVILLGVWSAILACVGIFSQLIEGVIFVGWIFYGLGAASIFILRRRPEAACRPYSVPGYPWTPLLFVLAAAALVVNAVLLAFGDPAKFRHLVVGLGLLAIGLPAYWFWHMKQRKGL